MPINDVAPFTRSDRFFCVYLRCITIILRRGSGQLLTHLYYALVQHRVGMCYFNVVFFHLMPEICCVTEKIIIASKCELSAICDDRKVMRVVSRFLLRYSRSMLFKQYITDAILHS